MAGTGFEVNAHRFMPYPNFGFVVIWDGRIVLGVSKVSAFRKTVAVMKYRGAGDYVEHKSMGLTTYDAITLERGITHDTEFEKWANMVSAYPGGPSTNLIDQRKDIHIVVRNERGQDVLRYFLYGAWVSEFQALPDLDANGNGVAIEHIKIEMEGWERDQSFTEQSEGAPVPNAT